MDQHAQEKSTAEKLGYARDARLLIINADGFGMCHDARDVFVNPVNSTGSASRRSLLRMELKNPRN